MGRHSLGAATGLSGHSIHCFICHHIGHLMAQCLRKMGVHRTPRGQYNVGVKEVIGGCPKFYMTRHGECFHPGGTQHITGTLSHPYTFSSLYFTP